MKAIFRRLLLLLIVMIGGVLPVCLWAVSPIALELQPPPPEAPTAHRGLMPPPENVITEEIDGRLFASGDIYVACHKDTIALKKYGFRQFEFLGRSVGTIRYHAIWPLAIDANALPVGLSGLNYAADPPRNEAFREYARYGFAAYSGNSYYYLGSRRSGRGSGGSSGFSYGVPRGST